LSDSEVLDSCHYAPVSYSNKGASYSASRNTLPPDDVLVGWQWREMAGEETADKFVGAANSEADWGRKARATSEVNYALT